MDRWRQIRGVFMKIKHITATRFSICNVKRGHDRNMVEEESNLNPSRRSKKVNIMHARVPRFKYFIRHRETTR